MKKIIISYIITFFILNISYVFAIDLPINTSDKPTISNWIISKENNIDDNQLKTIRNNTQSYFQNIPLNRVSELHLSNFNDVTISLYQLFDDIDFKSTFIAACIIETKNEQVSGFIYDDFDLDAEIYICLLYTSPSPRDGLLSRMPSSA